MMNNEQCIPECLNALNSAVTQAIYYEHSVGEYTVSEELSKISNEHRSFDKAKEHHIITNELANYDSIPVVALSISLNIKKGIKYYYYVTDKYSRDNEENFKNLIKGYLERNDDARRMIVAWIRKEFATKMDFVFFEKLFKNVGSSDSDFDLKKILNLFIEKTFDDNNCEKSRNNIVLSFNSNLYDAFCKWFKGEKTEGENKEEDSVFYNECTDQLSAALDQIKKAFVFLSTSKLYAESFRKSANFVSLNIMSGMYSLYLWQNSFKKSKNAKQSLEELSRKYLSIDNSIIDWLSGQADATDMNYLKNIIFYHRDDQDSFSYNFDLALNCKKDGSVEACWYTSTSPNEAAICGEKIDCGMVHVDAEADEFTDLYVDLVGACKDGEKKVEELLSNSALSNHINNKKGTPLKDLIEKSKQVSLIYKNDCINYGKLEIINQIADSKVNKNKWIFICGLILLSVLSFGGIAILIYLLFSHNDVLKFIENNKTTVSLALGTWGLSGLVSLAKTLFKKMDFLSTDKEQIIAKLRKKYDVK